jgi:hypothetical protein
MKYQLLQFKQFWGHNPYKKCYGFIIYNVIKGFSTILGHVIIWKVMTFKKVENKAPLIWTSRNMSNLTSFQCFCVFIQIFTFKNSLKKLFKWIL